MWWLVPVIVAVSATAFADDLPQPHGYPTWSPTVSLVLKDDHAGGRETSSAGVALEIARGTSRFQGFVEGSALWLQDELGGRELRGGGGLRWLARSFEIGDRGSIEMHLEGAAGVNRLARDGMERTFSDLAVGGGFQVRLTQPRFAFRATVRAVFERSRADDSMPGFVALFGFAY